MSEQQPNTASVTRTKKKRRPRADGNKSRKKWNRDVVDEALALYARTGSAVHVKLTLGVPEPTLRKWMTDPEKAARVADLRSRALELLGPKFLEAIGLGLQVSTGCIASIRTAKKAGMALAQTRIVSGATRDLANAYKAITPPVPPEPPKPDDTALNAPADDIESNEEDSTHGPQTNDS